MHETAPDDAPPASLAPGPGGADEDAPSELLTYELLTEGEASPATNMVITALGQVLARHEDRTEGAVADYIPELAKVDPDRYGVALASVHGRVYTAGDCSTPFTIQSVSKPFVYALALEDLGLDRVAEHIDFEPSGEPFNAISLDEASGRPSNPLINAGAIVSTSLVAADGPAERFARIRERLSAFAGRELELDDAVYASESATGDRNRALAHLAASSGVLGAPVTEAVDTYFRQCSLVVTARDLAVMGATLANSGINPVTGETVIHESTAMTVLSVMATCGMYDDSGEWMVRVGLPAKSGVGGGIVAVQPAEFGIGTFSPRLDSRGNSVRGIAALQDLSGTFGLHLLNHHRVPRSAIAGRDGGDGELRLTLRGELDFIAMEEIAHELVGFAVGTEGRGGTVTLDVTNVTLVRSAVEQFLLQAVDRLRTFDVELQIVDRTDGG
ncbi:glutaminase A [Dermatobacter hominis]|uniref:glutaminase A n=1 Tax=Dermatobacter hominis TaxID=2884263 RepID=UPI001D0FD9B6|nr:glutaminase A [Dermatobacter hominis]UDY35255.1 glutaminase A [Dermatobacter hominis]